MEHYDNTCDIDGQITGVTGYLIHYGFGAFTVGALVYVFNLMQGPWPGC